MSNNSSRWMARLLDDTPLTHVSIPGTHDAACHDLTGVLPQLSNSRWASLADDILPGGITGNYLVEVLAKTQTLNITQQLQAGVRFFDLRPSFREGDKLPIYHGIIRTTSTLPGVLNQVANFLNANPSEYVILRLKAESDDKSWQERKNILDKCLKNYTNYIYTQGNTKGAVSTARGKMVLLIQDIGSLNYTFNWNGAKIQDDYEINANENLISKVAQTGCNVVQAPIKAIGSLFGKKVDFCKDVGKKVPKIFVPDKVFDTKRLAIKDHHIKSISRKTDSSSDFHINFVSCVGAGADALLISPQVCATKLNPGIKNLISNNQNNQNLGFPGIVVMDFITEELASGIYSSNRFRA